DESLAKFRKTVEVQKSPSLDGSRTDQPVSKVTAILRDCGFNDFRTAPLGNPTVQAARRYCPTFWTLEPR
ncbi:hypothetical protein, partial [Mesorhizobium sp. M4B.F.Ca.ET.089.01.1.1]|uniref:hypothetical protein n=1 Tax=Mesorhizobium sp. M4B.F.Ca.ET.089.01.1.1 TaxID=2496662 RepID=UPI001AECA1BE